jgi:hypothetical protein
LGKDTGVVTVSTTVFDLNDGSVKVSCFVMTQSNRCFVMIVLPTLRVV